MEMEILGETKQPLFSRVEVRGKISFEAATPTREAVRDKMSKLIKKDKSLVMVLKIKNFYGANTADVTAHVYKTKEDVDKFVSKVIKKRMGLKDKVKGDVASQPKVQREEKVSADG